MKRNILVTLLTVVIAANAYGQGSNVRTNANGDVISGEADFPTGTLKVNGVAVDPTVSGGGAGNISVAHDFGTATTYTPSADTDAARGVSLKAAITASVAGETINLGPGTYDLGATAGLVLKNGVTINGSGSTVFYSASSGTANIFTDNGTAGITAKLTGALHIIAQDTGTATIRAVYATGDGTEIHIAPTVTFVCYSAAGNEIAIEVSDGASVYADGVRIQRGNIVAGAIGYAYIRNTSFLWGELYCTGGEIHADGMENLDGLVTASGGVVYLNDVNIIAPEGSKAVVLSGNATAYLGGRFEANNINNPALEVGPSTIVTIRGGSEFIGKGTAKSIAATSGNPTIRITGPLSSSTTRDTAITFTHATSEIGGIKEETQGANTFFGNGTGSTAAPTFMSAATARTAMGVGTIATTASPLKGDNAGNAVAMVPNVDYTTFINSTPASAGAACTAGSLVYDGSFIYVCTATNTWKRVAIATW